ncbi:C-factor [Fomes fomentarius]|nr:C-factor [Fomes fomentarius]
MAAENNTVERTIWLITGSSSGIGLELNRQLLTDSSNTIVATCQDLSMADALYHLQDTAKGTLHVAAIDVADESCIRDSVDVVKQLLGENARIDYLYNNAAILEENDTAFSFKPDVLKRTIHTNVIGPALLAQTYLPLLEKGKRKTIVNVTSQLASIGLAIGGEKTTYSISKAPLNMLTYKQKAERPDFTVIALEPGWVKTVMGGEGALLEPVFSVSQIIKTVASLTNEDSGKFFSYNGEQNRW